MHDAFKAWDRATEELEATEMRIHDGAPRERLRDRAHEYLDALRQRFPWSMPAPGAVVMEIGSGVGYVLEAALTELAPRQIIGLDVAPSMIMKAKERLRRDAVQAGHVSFLLYDGVSVPLSDGSVDYVYSVATLQHVPRVYVYNLLFEIKRILSPSGFCALHLLSTSHIQNSCFTFAQEIDNQLRGRDTHWHHFYSFDELLHVLADGLGAKQVDVVADQGSIWASFANRGPTFHRPDLPEETHLARCAAAEEHRRLQQASSELRAEHQKLRQEHENLRQKLHEAEALAAALQQLKTFRYTRQLRSVYGMLLGRGRAG
jgi:ubiquinone/menaquinone biosynthesis C-methylase UbiE